MIALYIIAAMFLGTVVALALVAVNTRTPAEDKAERDQQYKDLNGIK